MSTILRKLSPLTIFILLLAGIGLVYGLLTEPARLLIPVLVLGGIFMLYMLQMRGLRKKAAAKSVARRDAAAVNKAKARKSMPFRVIEGGKDDDNIPKYH
ncbi:hypothetical protein [Paenibacillus sp. GCM10027626]|uniref:hypothetical protein n=1 Tax=Paenibacillus sp. GCM10027626 TaxID=3273411 RepID=UPI00363C18A7